MSFITLASILPMFVGISFGAIVSGIAGAKGLLDSISGQRAANKANRDAMTALQRNQKIADENRAARTKFLQDMQALVDQMDAQGVFDPAVATQQARSALDQRKTDELQNAGAALATAGYKAGDSALERGLAGVAAANDQMLAEIASKAQSELPLREFQTRLSLNPGMLESPLDYAANSEAAQGYRYDGQRRMAGLPNLGQVSEGLMPFMDQLFKKRQGLNAGARIARDTNFIDSL